MVEINIEQLVKDCNLSYEQAEEMLGKSSTQGKIIGVTRKPGLGYAEGIYLTCSSFGQQSKYYRVGE